MELNEPNVSFKPEQLQETPYDKAKKVWDERLGTARVQAKNWRYSAFISYGITAFAILVLAYVATRSTFIPYIIELGPNGEVRAVGRADRMNYTPQERELKYFLGELVKKARSLPLDPVVAKENLTSVYKFLRPSAAQKMSEIIKNENPMLRLGNETVHIILHSVVPVSKSSYQVRWVENTYAKEGAPKGTQRMTGIFTLTFATPDTEEAIVANPLGIFVQDFSWSKEL